jgi:hypothetical protein
MKLGYISHFSETFPEPDDLEKNASGMSHTDRVKDFSSDLIKDYVQNAFPVKFQIFGAVFDVYDLTLIAGLGYTILLLILLYCLNTETTALRMVWYVSSCDGACSRAIYAILATRQVLTVPETGKIDYPETGKINDEVLRQNQLLPLDDKLSFKWFRSFPKLFVPFPVLVYWLIFGNDLMSYEYGYQTNRLHFIAWCIYSSAFALVIPFLAWRCWTRLKKLDTIWDLWSEALEKGPIPPAPKTVESGLYSMLPQTFVQTTNPPPAKDVTENHGRSNVSTGKDGVGAVVGVIMAVLSILGMFVYLAAFPKNGAEDRKQGAK